MDRWFLLDTNLDPQRPWKQKTNIPVFSMAMLQDEKGAEQWLVYAHSPLEDRQDVTIIVPEFGKVTVDVPCAGAFYLIELSNKKVKSIASAQVD